MTESTGLQDPYSWDEAPRAGVRHHTRQFNLLAGPIRLLPLRDALNSMGAAGVPSDAHIQVGNSSATGYCVVATWDEVVT